MHTKTEISPLLRLEFLARPSRLPLFATGGCPRNYGPRVLLLIRSSSPFQPSPISRHLCAHAGYEYGDMPVAVSETDVCAAHSYVCTYLRDLECHPIYYYELPRFQDKDKAEGYEYSEDTQRVYRRSSRLVPFLSPRKRRPRHIHQSLHIGTRLTCSRPQLPASDSRKPARSDVRLALRCSVAPVPRAHDKHSFRSCPISARRRPAQHLASPVRSSGEPSIRGKVMGVK